MSAWWLVLLSFLVGTAGGAYYYVRNHDRPGIDASEPLPAMPIDEEMPPKILTYRPREGRPIMSCHCHKKPLRPGDDVLWWPLPEGTVVLFCEQGVRELAGGK